MKNRSQISPEDVESENVNLCLAIWENMTLENQKEVEQAVKELAWDA